MALPSGFLCFALVFLFHGRLRRLAVAAPILPYLAHGWFYGVVRGRVRAETQDTE